MTLTWPWSNTHLKPFPKAWRSVYLGLHPSANWTCIIEVLAICPNMSIIPVTFSYQKLNKGEEKYNKNFPHLWTPFSQNNTIFKLIFFDFAQVISLELLNLQACVTPHFKGNVVEFQVLIITPIPQNATSVSFCQTGWQICNSVCVMS